MIDFTLFQKTLELGIGVSQRENAQLMDLLSQIVPLWIHRFASGREHNGWVVPHDWRVRKAEIRRDGRVVFDGLCHPLAVAGYSSSFSGRVSKAELDEHVFYRDSLPEAYVFHSVYNYRPWQKHWGFCIPWNEYRTWPDGEYEVDLDIAFEDGEMLVADAVIEGESPQTIVFNAHTCHPCQANDDMAGVFVLLELFSRLRRRKLHWTYRLVLAPEHLGTVFYIASLGESELRSIRLGVFAEMLGSDGPLVLQKSFSGESRIDHVAEDVLSRIEPDLHVGAFRTIVGNDETVWEAPGVEVPMISVSRWPYPEYHSSFDSLDIMHPEKLNEAVDALEAMVDVLEADRVVQRRFTGLVALSNPKYDLYVERPDPVVEKGLTEEDLRFGEMQDRLPRYFDGEKTLFEMAREFGVDFRKLRAYLDRFEEKGLVELDFPQNIK